mgnify:FL=1
MKRNVLVVIALALFLLANCTFVDHTSPDSLTVLVGKDHPLPKDYEPEDLVVPNVRFPFTEDDPKKQLRKEAAEALEQRCDAAE